MKGSKNEVEGTHQVRNQRHTISIWNGWRTFFFTMEIKEFLLITKHTEYNQLNDDHQWLNLAFLTDLTSKLQHRDLGNFQNLTSELVTQQKSCSQTDHAHYMQQTDNCLSEFDRHFPDFVLLEPVAIFMCNPFPE